MDWYERLGPARPPVFRNWIMPTEISAEELGTLTGSLRADEPAGSKSSLNLTIFCKCLYATAKMEAQGNEDCVGEEEFHDFYRLLPCIVEMFMTDVPCLKYSPQASETLLYAMGFLVDLTKFMLASLNPASSSRRIGDVTSIVQALCKALDADLPFHQMHVCIPLPGPVMDSKRRYVSSKSVLAISGDIPTTPGKRRKSVNGTPVNPSNSTLCRCADFGPRSPECNLWIKSLVEYFGRGCPGYDRPVACGFENLKVLLPRLHTLPIELTCNVLHLFGRMTEYLKDDLQSNFLHTFMLFLKRLSTRCEENLDQQSTEDCVTIVKHVRCLLDFFLTPELAQKIVRPLENQILQKLLSFTSPEDDVGKVTIESSPTSPIVCEEVSCATSKRPIHRLLDKAADWFRLTFHFSRNKRRAEPTSDNLFSR